MHKVLAEIVAGVIPHKLTRNRWRGILRFGIRNAFRLKREIKRHHEPPRDYLSVVVIAKDEGPYFKEWLDWHIAQGVDRFYVYDNESTDNTLQILQPYIDKGIVVYTPFPGHRMQLAAYDHVLRHHRFDTRWLAVIDMDEFIVPLKHSSIPDYLRELEKYSVVEVNWLCYGSSGQKEKLPGSQMERFRRHSLSSHTLNHHVKSIFDPRRVYGMIGCHEVARMNGLTADADGNPVKIPWRNRPATHDTIKINHYAVRSYEEFREKQLRGRASGPSREVSDDYFNFFDLNDVSD